jgi:GntR family transcriptional regulator / MocR family aminotransferase
MYVELEGEGPTYLRLYRGLRSAITGGGLAPGTRLPSTRELAAELDVSRNTVLRAYEQLLAEGLASATHGGTFVGASAPEAPASAGPSCVVVPLAPAGLRIVEAARSSLLRKLMELERVPYDFIFGIPDPTIFPLPAWRRALAHAADRASNRVLSYGDPRGDDQLRAMIVDHVTRHRGVRCTSDDVVIVGGAQQALDLAVRLLVAPGDAVLLEDPGYPTMHMLLDAAGAEMIAAPVDGDGLDLSGLSSSELSRCRVAYVTPSHQFPSGAVMSRERRDELLVWAADTGATIIEDDYDGDYRHVGPPLPALQGLAPERVLYVGTFSKSLFPSLRLGYAIVPRALREAFAAAKWVSDWSEPTLLQRAVAHLMQKGDFQRHVKRSAAVYRRRRDALVDALDTGIPGVRVRGGDAGMHVVAWLPVATEALPDVVAGARAVGVGVYSIAPFFIRPPPASGIVLGYSSLAEGALREGIARLAPIVAQARRG